MVVCTERAEKNYYYIGKKGLYFILAQRGWLCAERSMINAIIFTARKEGKISWKKINIFLINVWGVSPSGSILPIQYEILCLPKLKTFQRPSKSKGHFTVDQHYIEEICNILNKKIEGTNLMSIFCGSILKIVLLNILKCFISCSRWPSDSNPLKIFETWNPLTHETLTIYWHTHLKSYH